MAPGARRRAPDRGPVPLARCRAEGGSRTRELELGCRLPLLGLAQPYGTTIAPAGRGHPGDPPKPPGGRSRGIPGGIEPRSWRGGVASPSLVRSPESSAPLYGSRPPGVPLARSCGSRSTVCSSAPAHRAGLSALFASERQKPTGRSGGLLLHARGFVRGKQLRNPQQSLSTASRRRGTPDRGGLGFPSCLGRVEVAQVCRCD